MDAAPQHPDDPDRQTDSRSGDASPTSRRAAFWIKWISIAAIAVCFVLLLRLLPVENGVRFLRHWIDGMGPLGPAVFALVYVLAAILFVPGSALTLLAGAIFGLLWGTVIVSIASTLAAALAFLIARYLARRAVERNARKYPRFAAVDEAIGREGWKIIVLLRLSPAIPYSAGNYLYGLTAVRFWPYVLASWLAMLPGTFMYVYLGHLGRTGLAGAERTAGQWTLLVVGLAATVAVTVYITYIARKAIGNRLPEPEHASPHDAEEPDRRPASSRPALIASASALLAVALTACSYANRSKLSALLGPPSVTMTEAYERNPGGPIFDHSPFDEVLSEHVDADGWVDYEGLLRDTQRLDAYIASLSTAPFELLDRDDKLALLINAYNAFTLRLILDHYPIESIKDIPARKRWDDVRWKVGRHTWSLNQIEHEQIRPKFEEPRIHFALVCAAAGCPILRDEAYTAARLEQQLHAQAQYVHTHDRWFRYDPSRNLLHLTRLYKWYGSDFEQTAGSIERFAAQYSPRLQTALDAGTEPTIRWLDYDWSLNSLPNKPAPRTASITDPPTPIRAP